MSGFMFEIIVKLILHFCLMVQGFEMRYTLMNFVYVTYFPSLFLCFNYIKSFDLRFDILLFYL